MFPLKLESKTAWFAAVLAAVSVVGIVGVLLWQGRMPIVQVPLGPVSLWMGGTPPRHQKVAQTSDFRIFFAEAMDHASTEESLIAPEDLPGTGRWEGEVYAYHPSSTPELGRTYAFVLKAGAKRSDGTPIPKTIDYTFTVAGAPVVMARVPAPDSPDIGIDSHIILTFDRPIVPLAAVQSAEAKSYIHDWPVTIRPAVQGRWHWLGTTTAEFIPITGLTPATRYTVEAPKGLLTAMGERTEMDFTWSFTTELPEISESSPTEAFTSAGPTTPITLSFTQDIDLASLKEHITFRGITASGGIITPGTKPNRKIAIQEVHYARAVDDHGKETTEDDKRRAVIVLAEPLRFSSAYILEVSPGVRGTRGDLGSANAFTLRFATVGSFDVMGATYEYGNGTITFSNPIEPGTLTGHIAISPAVERWKDVVFSVDSWNESKYATFTADVKPSTTYTLTFDDQIRDAFGQHLRPVARTATFTTAPVTPQLTIKSKGLFGIFERDKPPVLHVNSVNISRLDVSFAKLSLPEFLSVRDRMHNLHEQNISLTSFAQHRSWQTPLPKLKDEWRVTPVDLEKAVGKLDPGIYAVAMRAPEYVREEWNPSGATKKVPVIEYQIFVLTDMAITLKYSGDRVLTWVTNVQTGEPVRDAIVQFHAISGTVPLQGTTDAQGFFESAVNLRDLAPANTYGYYDWEPEFWVTAEKDGDFAFVGSDWTNGIHGYDFGMYENFRGPNSAAMDILGTFMTERPAYRPGDTVHFHAMVRLLDREGDMHIPVERRAHVSITDAKGTEVFKKDLAISAFGGVAGEFPLAADAVLGDYSMTLDFVPGDDTGYNRQYSSFSVLAYRKPEYKASVEFVKEEYFNHDTLDAHVDGAYYFGAPMAGAKVEWRLNSTDYYFSKYTGSGWYSFSVNDTVCQMGDSCFGQSLLVESGKGVLDAEGRLNIRLPVDIDSMRSSQVVSLEADVLDPNNQIVSTYTSVPVHRSKVYVGVRNDTWAVKPGDNAPVSVIALKTDGTPPAAGQRIHVELFSRNWNTIRTKGVDGEYYYDNKAEDKLISGTDVTVGADGRGSTSIRIPSGGEYVIVASATDADGRVVKAATSIYAWSSVYINWPHENNDRISVVPDKTEYKVGDTATLLVKSPYQGKGVKALVTVEREHIVSKRIIDITGSAQAITVPITEDLVPNAFVSVVIIKARTGETFDDQGRDTGLPAFKVGYASLPIDISLKRLAVTVSTDRRQYAPGEKVTAVITAKDAAGKPVQGEFSLGVVDMSVLALMGFNMPDPVGSFYMQRGLGVRTSQMLLYMLERFKPGSKGGGGGMPEAAKRGEFKDTAYWNPSIVTGPDGTATVTFKLPDNLTTWHLLAVGQTKDNKFGAAEATMIETKHVIVRPVRPRFAVRGDEMQVGAIVHNFLPQRQDFEVTLSGSGFTQSGQKTQTISLAASGSTKLLWPIRITDGAKVLFNFRAEGGNARDEIEETIPVFHFTVPQMVATSGVVEDTLHERVFVPREDEAENPVVALQLSPTLASYMPAGLQYLTNFPYGCAEQTVSGFLPAVALSRLQAFAAFRTLDRKALENRITTGMQTIASFQRSDGGFGFWQDSDRSYPYLTAYVLYGLHEAKNAGFHVDAGMMKRAEDYLSAILRSTRPEDQVDLATRANILFVLAEQGRNEQSLLNNLYDQRKELPIFAQAQLAMALQDVAGPVSSKRAGTIVTEIMNHVKVDPRGTHFEEANAGHWGWSLNTNDRTTAVVLRMLVRLQPEHVFIPRIVRYLLTVREDGHWDTTQSTTAVLLAFTDFLEESGELEKSVTARVGLNGKEILNHTFDPTKSIKVKDVDIPIASLQRGAENEIGLQRTGDGRLYYDFTMKYDFTGESIPPAEEGIGLTRDLVSIDPKVSGIAVGGTYKLTLTVTVPEERHFVAVESPLPAGFELIDLRFLTSQRTLLEGQANKMSWDDWWKNQMWRFTHTELRDDRVFLFADELPAGVYKYEYLVRATTPGRFRLRPARAWEMYFPEVFGQTEGGWFTIGG